MSAHPLWRGDRPLLLASTSAIRAQLLERAGIPVETVASGVDERRFERELGSDVTAASIALHLAAAKAAAVAAAHPGRLVLGADQVLECEGRCHSKPGSPAEACRQLATLAGRQHALHSAAVLLRAGQVEMEEVVTARLAMRVLVEAEIAHYVEAAGDAATRSAGGYEIEGLGINLFSAVEGEHTTILGLPILPLLGAFRRLGLLAL